jgi:hypothetical protein
MMLPQILVLICQTATVAAPGAEGVIAGRVVNASRGSRSADGVQVVLQIHAEGQFAPFRETVTDALGQFRFENLPVGGDYLYLVGASRDGVYHPGPRLQVLAHRPSVRTELKVYDAVASPNPLVIRRQEIVLCPEPGVLRVTESLLVENPTDKCFVGQRTQEDAEPVTLRLSIPAEFERATFEEEFFGRRFSLAEGALVTGIPWPPGQREIKFTYVLRNEKKYYALQRPMDLPCEQLRVRVRTANPEQVACDLPSADRSRTDLKSVPPGGEAVFESTGEILPTGHVLHVDLGRLPLPLMAYARWVAVAALALLMATVSRLAIWPKQRPSTAAATSAE